MYYTANIFFRGHIDNMKLKEDLLELFYKELKWTVTESLKCLFIEFSNIS